MQFWAPDDGRKTRLKHVERLTEIKKLWNVASCWLYSANILAMHGPINVKFSGNVLSTFRLNLSGLIFRGQKPNILDLSPICLSRNVYKTLLLLACVIMQRIAFLDKLCTLFSHLMTMRISETEPIRTLFLLLQQMFTTDQSLCASFVSYCTCRNITAGSLLHM